MSGGGGVALSQAPSQQLGAGAGAAAAPLQKPARKAPDAFGLADCDAASCGGVDVAGGGVDAQRARSSDASAQTVPPRTAEHGGQAVERADAGEQSEPLGAFAHLGLHVAEDGTLLDAMRVAAPKMEGALRANSTSRAFLAGAGGTAPRARTSLPEAAHELHVLRDAEASDKEGLVASAVAWSSTGSVLCVAYGRFDIDGWCAHRGRLSLWNLARHEIDDQKPDSAVQLGSCALAIACCPAHPALVAAGTFDGEVIVADMSLADGSGDPLRSGRGVSRCCAASHREPVTAVEWVWDVGEAAAHSRREEAYKLVSVAGDGRVLVWRWTDLSAPLYAYELWHAHPRTKRRLRWGGSCLALHGEGGGGGTNAGFLVGTEGGAVFRCRMQHTQAMEEDFRRQALAEDAYERERAEMRTPIQASHEAHEGPVHACAFSSFAPQLFATAGADGAMRLHHVNTLTAIKMLEPADGALYSVRWSASRPMVLAAGALDGRVHVYDLGASALHPIAVLDACGTKGAVHSIAFNARFPELLAATGARGEVKVFELCEELHKPREGEETALRRWAAAAAGEA